MKFIFHKIFNQKNINLKKFLLSNILIASFGFNHIACAITNKITETPINKTSTNITKSKNKATVNKAATPIKSNKKIALIQNQTYDPKFNSTYIQLKKGNLKKISLQDVLQIAYEYGPKFKFNNTDYQQKSEEVKKNIYSRFLPKVTVGAQLSNSSDKITSSSNNINQSNKSDFNANISVTQNLFHSGHDVLAAKSAMKDLSANSNKFFLQETANFLEVIQNYLELIVAKELYKISQETLNDSKTLFEAEEQKKIVGFSSELNYQIAKSNYQVSIASTNEAMISHNNALNSMKATLSFDENLDTLNLENVEFIWPKLPEEFKLNYKLLEEKIKQQNFKIKASQDKVASAEYAEKAAATSLLPKIDASFVISNDLRNRDLPVDMQKSSYQGVLSLTVPIFDPQTIGSIKSAKYTKANARYGLADAQRATLVEFNKTFNNLDNLFIQCKAREMAYKSANLAAKAAKDQYYLGQKSMIDYVNLRQKALESYQIWVKKKQELILSWYNLLGHLGELDAKNLDIKGKIFAPKSENGSLTKNL